MLNYITIITFSDGTAHTFEKEWVPKSIHGTFIEMRNVLTDERTYLRGATIDAIDIQLLEEDDEK